MAATSSAKPKNPMSAPSKRSQGTKNQSCKEGEKNPLPLSSSVAQTPTPKAKKPRKPPTKASRSTKKQSSKDGEEKPLHPSSPMTEPPTHKVKKTKNPPTMKQPTKEGEENSQSWGGFKTLFSWKDTQPPKGTTKSSSSKRRKSRKIGCSGSLCNSRDNPVIQKPDDLTPPETAKKCVGRSIKSPNEAKGTVSATTSFSSACMTASSSTSSSASSVGGSFRGMQLRRFSGCYECRMVDPINGLYRIPTLRVSVLPCPDCGEIFVKAETLELHQAAKHAVSELGPSDTSRNIVEIIFQSSWLKKNPPVCKIDRILKVHNSKTTISKFETYRESIKLKAAKLAPKKHPRCAADGNELLRFHCTTLSCPLGLNGATNLCHSTPSCQVCNIIRDGFRVDGQGRIATMATSGRAHDAVKGEEEKGRAMLVCRVVAGRVRKGGEVGEECDSVAGSVGVYEKLDELFVFSSKAILPCFVVVYSGF